jgi:hypothetical protein
MAEQEAKGERPLVLDELSKQLEQFRILRTGADTDATERLLSQLGANDPVEAHSSRSPSSACNS